MQKTCPRCGSDRIIPRVPLPDHYGDTGYRSDTAEVYVHGSPDAWFFKDTVSGKLFLRICGGCGYAELNVSNHQELWEKYARSRTPAAPERAQVADSTPDRQEACLSCGKAIPGNATCCPACGWTWGPEAAP